MLGRYATELVISFAVSYLAVRFLDPIVRRYGWLDHPRGRKDHAHPTPVTGGLAIILGVLAVMPMLRPLPEGALVVTFCLGALLLLVTGGLDDLYDLPWIPRVAAQCVAALILVYIGGVRAEHIGPFDDGTMIALGNLSVPFTVFITVGIINAVNMADGSDGLAGSLALTSLLMLAAASAYAGNDTLIGRIVPFIGAVAGFLVMNVRHRWQPHARVFLGNSGSAIIGFTLAWLAIRVSHTPGHPVSSILVPWLMAPALIDCVTLMGRRLLEHRSPFSADRGHMHHLLLDAGYSPSQVARILAGLSLALGLAAAKALYLNVRPSLLVVAFVALIAAHYWFTADRTRAVRFLALLRTGAADAADDGPIVAHLNSYSTKSALVLADKAGELLRRFFRTRR